ncbi:kinase-regulated stress-responsive transcription factor skn7 [Tulasnella sp. 417]|nr:kinase-regulated stress-responsive transcription factor skn7 [Tulasnella sp. 417]
MSMLLSPPFSTTSRGSNISGESAPSPAHLSDSNQPQQEHPLSPAATSPHPQNGDLWNELQKRYADHIQQPGLNVAKKFYRPQAPRLQHGLPPNEPLRESRPFTTATAPAPAQAEAESTFPAKQEPSAQEGLSILSSVPGPSAGLAANVTDNADPTVSSDAPLPQIAKGTPTPAWAVSPRVLLVDDDEVSRRLFSRFLQVLGCIVDVAVDGIGGVNKMNLETYDLVLMDIFMPKLDGMQATSIIRQSDHTTPIISMTTNPKPDDIANYSLAGMNDILPKPFTWESLSLVLEQNPQPGQPGGRMQFHEFFTKAFNGWLAQRQLTLDPPRVDGKEVGLHKLFLMVGALGGCRAVSEKRLWPVVGAKIGFAYFNGPLPYSKAEVAEQLSKIYQKILADFEVHWHNSLRVGDPNSTFPLPPQLQYLHPEISRLATAQLQLQQPQHPQFPWGGGPHPQLDVSANQPGEVAPPQADPPGQAGPMVAASLANLPPQVQQFLTSPEGMRLSPDELKRRGISEEIIQRVMIYRNQLIAKSLQGRKEQELQLQQQRQLQAQQQARLLNLQSQTPQLVSGNQPSSSLGGGADSPGSNMLRPSALPQSDRPQVPATVPLLPGLNIPPEQFIKAQEKIRAAIGLFHNKRDYSSVHLTRDQEVLLEHSLAQTQSLLKQVAQHLVSFVVLAPNNERELNQVAQTVVTLSDQAQILQKQPPEKRFIMGLGDLNNYRNHLTTFLMRVKGLQSQALAAQNEPSSSALPPVPPQVKQEEPPAPIIATPHSNVPFHS